jgi:hypothetical protein
MATITVEQSRAIPIELQRAFDVTLPMPLTAGSAAVIDWA